MTPRGWFPIRLATASRRAGSLPVTPSDLRMDAKSVSRDEVMIASAQSCSLGAHPPLPLRLERLHFGSREIAVPCPPAGERQPAEAAEQLAHQAERENPERCGERIEPRPSGKPSPQRNAAAHRRRRQMPFELALAPVAHQL